MTRKMMLAAAGLVGLLVVAVILAFRGATPVTKEGENLSATVKQVGGDFKMISPIYNSTDRSIYFFDYGELKVAKVREGGEVSYLSDALSGIEEALWAPDFSKVLLRNVNDLTINPETIASSPMLRGDQPNLAVLTWLYDLRSRRLTFLTSEYGSVLWESPMRIVYHFVGEDGGEISSANPDGSDFKILTKVESVGVRELLGLVPNTGVVFSGAADEEERNIYFVRFGSEPTLVSESASGEAGPNHVVYQILGNEKVLWAHDISTGSRSRIFSAEERIDVYAIDGDTVFVASETGLTLVDLQARVRRGLVLNAALPPVEGFIPADAKAFYFTSDGTLYRVDLP